MAWGRSLTETDGPVRGCCHRSPTFCMIPLTPHCRTRVHTHGREAQDARPRGLPPVPPPYFMHRRHPPRTAGTPGARPLRRPPHDLGTNLMEMELTQWRELVGVKRSPLNSWPKWPPQLAHVISMRCMPRVLSSWRSTAPGISSAAAPGAARSGRQRAAASCGRPPRTGQNGGRAGRRRLRRTVEGRPAAAAVELGGGAGAVGRGGQRRRQWGGVGWGGVGQRTSSGPQIAQARCTSRAAHVYSGVLHARQTYCPSSKCLSYSPVRGGSVPFWRST